MSNHDPHPPTLPNSHGVNWGVFLLAGWSAAVVTPLRSHTGRDYLASAGLGAFAAIFLFAWGTKDPAVLWAYAPFLVGLVVNRVQGVRAFWAGEQGHTWYTGRPWVAQRLFGLRSEVRAKLVGEPVLVVGMALVLAWLLSEPLAAFTLVGGLLSPALCLMWELEERRAAERVINARIEAEGLAERVRTPRHH